MTEKAKEIQPSFLVFEGKKEVKEKSTKKKLTELEQDIIKFLEDQIQEIKEKKDRPSLTKAFLVTCFGDSPEEYSKFLLSTINLEGRDFNWITQKIAIEYLLNEIQS